MLEIELYVCKDCQHIELELSGECPECGGEMECVDFVDTRGLTLHDADSRIPAAFTCEDCGSSEM